MKIAVIGAGAFGTALAITLSRKTPVFLWARDQENAQRMQAERTNATRLPGSDFPEAMTVTHSLHHLEACDIFLLAVPMQRLRGCLTEATPVLQGKTLVACCKGIELDSGMGPLDIIEDVLPTATRALLTGPSFAADIANELPTALTLACADTKVGMHLQNALSTPTLRLYRTTDTIGASLGGALKNVVAIACGVAIGAGLGESARAALMTRGNAEMKRLAALKNADPETLSGLSGFGDLVLTCTSDQSRNYRLGLSIGAGTPFDAKTTVEGAATARALAKQALREDLDLPIVTAVAALVDRKLEVADAMTALLSRSLKEE